MMSDIDGVELDVVSTDVASRIPMKSWPSLYKSMRSKHVSAEQSEEQVVTVRMMDAIHSLPFSPPGFHT
jgi:hypothetical protein